MITLKLVDNSGEMIASSARPVAIPFQSPISLFLDAVTKFPLRLFGFVETAETVSVAVNFMTNYMDTSAISPPTTQLEFFASSADVDIVETRLTIMPSLSGMT